MALFFNKTNFYLVLQRWKIEQHHTDDDQNTDYHKAYAKDFL